MGFFTKIFEIVMVCFLLMVAGASAGSPTESLTVKKFDQEIKEHEQSLESTRSQIKANRKKIKEIQTQEGNILAKLELLEKDIDNTQRLIKRLDKGLLQLIHLVDSLSGSLGATEGQLSNHREVMMKRLRFIYKQGQFSMLETLLLAPSLTDFYKRFKFFKILTDRDRDRLRGIDREKTQLETERTLLDSHRLKMQDIRSEQAEEIEALLKSQSARKTIFENLKEKRASHEKLIKEFVKKENELEGLLVILEKSRKEAAERLKRRGKVDFGSEFSQYYKKLPWPVQGQILNQFGPIRHPKFATVTFNKGIDIRAGEGAPVTSIAKGEVVYTGWLRGYGKIVLLDHSGGFYTLYGNLGEILVDKGTQVNSGGVIGAVGDTGSLEGFKLHFEIRMGKDSLNPLEWLTSSQQ